MRNAVYPSYSSHLSSFGNDLQMLNFDPSSNVCASSFFRDSQVSNDLHLGRFSPMSTIEISQALTSLQIPEVLPNTTLSVSQPRPQSITSASDVKASILESKHFEIKSSRKRNAPLDPKIGMEESKKMKAVCDEDQRPCPPIEEPRSDMQEKKAPVRRSQKIGDKITTLQKLVSPFGKTDTASVLQEAAAYIKYLQEQIEVLSAPYFTVKSLHFQGVGGRNMDLSSRGLCLVPVSYTKNLTKEDQVEHSITRKTIIPRKY